MELDKRGSINRVFKRDTLWGCFGDGMIDASRVPRESLLFAIPTFGGVVSWEGEGSPFNESDQSITHQTYPNPLRSNPAYSVVKIIRDIIQNHLLQILCLIAMEKPISLTAEQSSRDEA
ncbi:hypothetical protein LOK49_LG02G01366 [Camellia lanceoleosa]|uniref:Uncharacterized protein n=1 Tax=Camellia lanceoleosa TaxID=1840588 RepID=A0ACC0ILC5_9ERIC|nr:hypothetical protein LOK49_LG02G01366 [Camellia lanceoleosa]